MKKRIWMCPDCGKIVSSPNPYYAIPYNYCSCTGMMVQMMELCPCKEETDEDVVSGTKDDVSTTFIG